MTDTPQTGPAQTDLQRTVDAIKAPSELPVAPEFRRLSKQERAFYAAQTEGLRQDIHERKKYASRIFILCGIWIFAAFLLLIAEGLSRWTGFNLPQPVLLAAIGSTTANIIAVFVIVARYLISGPRPLAEHPLRWKWPASLRKPRFAQGVEPHDRMSQHRLALSALHGASLRVGCA